MNDAGPGNWYPRSSHNNTAPSLPPAHNYDQPALTSHFGHAAPDGYLPSDGYPLAGAFAHGPCPSSTGMVQRTLELELDVPSFETSSVASSFTASLGPPLSQLGNADNVGKQLAKDNRKGSTGGRKGRAGKSAIQKDNQKKSNEKDGEVDDR